MGDFLKKAIRIVGKENVLIDDVSKVSYSRDLWQRHLIWLSKKKLPKKPYIIVSPKTTEEVAKLIKLCYEDNIPFIPYGGGSGVCGGAMPIKDNTIIIDLKRMNKYKIHKDQLVLEVEAGANGYLVESFLESQGFKIGHFPSSIYCSTWGGYASARSAGQESSLYGKAEDMILFAEVVLPTGEIKILSSIYDKQHLHLILGSEGTLGIITKLWVKLYPKPKYQFMHSVSFKGLESGIDGMTKIMQSGLTPFVMRLYDEFDTFINYPVHKEKKKEEKRKSKLKAKLKEKMHAIKDLSDEDGKKLLRKLLSYPTVINILPKLLPNRSIMILGYEGNDEYIVQKKLEKAMEILLKNKAIDEGKEYGYHWLEHRYDISFFQSLVFSSGAFVDTMEVATTYSNAYKLYRAVKRSVFNKAFIMAHLSHAYLDGVALYFSIAGYFKKDNEVLYQEVWNRMLNTVNKMGGTITHHHGVGILKSRYLKREYSNLGEETFYYIKKQLDPKGISNPEKLLKEYEDR